MGGIDWGDAPTWGAAVFAGGAAVFAGVTMVVQRRQINEQRQFIAEQSQNLQLERSELQAQAEDRKHTQARAVVMVAELPPSGSTAYNLPGPADHWEVFVRNGSAGALSDVTVRFGDAYNATNATPTDVGGVANGRSRGVPIHLIGSGRSFKFESRGSVRWPWRTPGRSCYSLTVRACGGRSTSMES
ncbi:hypothetical protein [Streptomyces sp. FIT100]|uniref:hypothetical protein n=1 Tax=Streptomyces sp. FIT100 TaxID=2837956 RepID=UPI0021C68F4B|nr:hypothetical protein [Streptomyces sp. FIT100]UUN27034.1 hypothetical protein KK483_11945 [Streptomyces sp. FIT100]